MLGIKINQKILIGVSGGPDSMFLLDLLVNQGYQQIIVCHVNYHTRTSSIRDEAIVKRYCDLHHLKYYNKNITSEFEDNHTNFESTARKLRYDFFAQIGLKENATILLIAHNLNDHIETYLLQKQRHNLVDYYGLKVKNKYQQLTVLRPLLNQTKSSILNHVNQKKIPFGIDETNFDLKYARNQLRSQLNEVDFDFYLAEIKQANHLNEADKQVALKYFTKNLIGDKLVLDSWFYHLSQKQVMFVLINYFKYLKVDQIFLHRKNNTLKAIAQTLLTSKKPILKIKIPNYWLVKDFNTCYFLIDNEIELVKTMINNHQELNQLTTKWVQELIAKDGFQFPYLLTNDFENYKLKTFCQKKKTNRFFIDHKISFFARVKQPAIIRLNNQQLINYQNFLGD
ncbi:tRNA(Ile)-lysidine synthase [Mesoplasma sp. JKS002658]|uniref:tRNA lysidine(34) synthetase TilS n=1 Tax=Mesoplasma whartonense TaxID=2878854 RepID=UPI002022B58B|nr:MULTISPECIES: tRNA lysidine(34) synthetase TilS [unclassified Mesoplasma]MCL8211650.1 tRNA(Ile)-lysidine synthase [Mesoplasma sp. JKS002664]MCL8212389.1 tRNA(Ile)-lysidine synthase [Mesoplasma sp. JKS002662]MCL8214366.1 tRNA(Ile)-lysidine synthase [Mesoplasma sp. JKS002658]MCL8214947.1 tRNA(Ile)-lysidine synthase [Mesoplasma sp. JKS002663]MCL8215687.1 tRNA(Ile)-lysidine synthase [Mesoplasma sp. JKS002659]